MVEELEEGAGVEALDLKPGSLHLVVFGPGTGEAIVVRLPDGRVGVIDCGGLEGVREVLAACGVQPDVGERLLFACLTHPHADHFKGFADLVDTYKPEHLWWAGDEEGALFKAWCRWEQKEGGRKGTTQDIAHPDPPRSKGIKRVSTAIEHSFNRRPTTRHRTLVDRKLLLEAGDLCIESVLPTTSEKRDALKRLIHGKELRDGKAANDLSGAILISWRGRQLLLGGDCNTGSSDEHTGWAGHGEDLGCIDVVKVPHHGSDSSWHEDSWAAWRPTWAVVTPHVVRSATQPPTSKGVEWLAARCPNLLMTRRKPANVEELGGEVSCDPFGFVHLIVPAQADEAIRVVITPTCHHIVRDP